MSTATVTLSAADLLKSAATKAAPAKKASGLLYDGPPEHAAMAFEVLTNLRATNEAEKAEKFSKTMFRELLDPWYQNEVKLHGYQASVLVLCNVRDDCSVESLRISYQHRYSIIPADREPVLRGIVGEKYDTFFKQASSLKVKKEIAEDPERLTAVVQSMLDGTVAEHFADWFSVEQTISVTRTFTERRYCELSAEQNAALEHAGVVQVCSFSDGTRD